jgi:tRNA threonylcarbamoyladenosine biosynthesis protein TsaE
MHTLHSDSVDQTFALGATLGRRVFPGAFIALIGDLGAGKTAFVRGVGAGMGVTTRVQSPTYILVQAHEGGRLPLWHADFYRLGEADELDAIGFFDLVGGDGVVVAEWADKFPDALPSDRLEIRLDIEGDNRILTVLGTGDRHRAIEAFDREGGDA